MVKTFIRKQRRTHQSPVEGREFIRHKRIDVGLPGEGDAGDALDLTDPVLQQACFLGLAGDFYDGKFVTDHSAIGSKRLEVGGRAYAFDGANDALEWVIADIGTLFLSYYNVTTAAWVDTSIAHSVDRYTFLPVVATVVHNLKLWTDNTASTVQKENVAFNIIPPNLWSWYKCDDTHSSLAFNCLGDLRHADKIDVTPGTFHYEGADVLYSWQDSVGYSTNVVNFLNAGFDSADNWTVEGGWAISGGTATHTPGTADQMMQAYVFEPGIEYTVTGTVSGQTTNQLTIRTSDVSDGSGNTVDSANFGSNGLFSLTITPNSSNNYLGFSTDTAWDGSLDNVSVAAVGSLKPRNESDTTNDIFGLTLPFVGLVPHPAKLFGSPRVTFDGSNDTAKADARGITSSVYPIVLACRFKTDSTGPNNPVIMAMSKSTVDDSYIHITHDETSQELAMVRRNINTKVTILQSTLSEDVDHSLVLVLADDVSVRCYVDGVEVLNSSSEESVTWSGEIDNVTLGFRQRSTGAANHYKGNIYDGRLYNLAMSKAEAEKFHAADHEMTSIPFRWWPVADGDSFIITDVAGLFGHIQLMNITVADAWAETQDDLHYNMLHGYDQVLTLSGTANHVDLTTLPTINIGAGAFSLSVWIRTVTVGGALFAFITTSQSLRVEADLLLLSIDSNNLVWTATDINDDTWHHIAVTRDVSGNFLAYMDGILLSLTVGTTPDTQDLIDLVRIGEAADGTVDYAGALSRAKVYSDVLTPAEVTILSNGGKVTDALILDLDFNDGIDTTVLDRVSKLRANLVGSTETLMWALQIPAQVNGKSTITSGSPLNPFGYYNGAHTSVDFTNGVANSIWSQNVETAYVRGDDRSTLNHMTESVGYLVLDGIDAYVHGSIAGVTYPCAMSCWLYSDADGDTENFIGICDESNSSVFFSLGISGTNFLQMLRANTTNFTTSSTLTWAYDSNWHHVVVVLHSATSFTIYLDGESGGLQDGLDAVVIDDVAFDTWVIGVRRHNSPINFWTGDVEGCEWYNETLTDSEVALLANRQIITKFPLRQCLLNNDNSLIIKELRGFDGTLVGTTILEAWGNFRNLHNLPEKYFYTFEV